MKPTRQYSDEMLNAYLDGELDTDEQKGLIEALNTEQTLNQRVCELARVRRMVQVAYHDVTADYLQNTPPARLSRKFAAIAAGLVLVVGTSLGWVAHQYTHTPQGLLELASHVEFNNQRAAEETWRVLLHLTTDNPTRLQVVLDEAEALLEQRSRNNQPVQMQILANGKGLNLLRADTSAYSQRIKAMQERYKNLVFVACGTAIRRLQEEKKLNVQLLPDIDVAPSALGEVMQKQSQGWTYIKI